jgi:hypothetical protein
MGKEGCRERKTIYKQIIYNWYNNFYTELESGIVIFSDMTS